jgi:hypothetical protein
MAFKAELNLEGERRLVDFSFSLSRDVDPTGRPSGLVRGGSIQLTVESTEDTSLFEWITDPSKHKSGSIKIYKQDNDAVEKEVKFEKAYIVNYGESYHWQGQNNMLETFTLSAEKIEVGGGEHDNEWPAS